MACVVAWELRHLVHRDILSRRPWFPSSRSQAYWSQTARLNANRWKGSRNAAEMREKVWWAMLGSNQRPLPCEDSALPLS